MSANCRSWRNSRDGMTTERYNAECGEEIVEVAEKFKGRVFGKGKHKIRQIQETSGAFVRVCNDGFVVRGSAEQREYAKMLIQDVVNPPMNMACERKDNDADNEEVVYVAKYLIGRVIGKEGRNIQVIAQQSGAFVKVCDVGFLVSGSKGQKQNAKEHILQIVKDVPWETLDIPEEFKGVVIGKGGQNLNKISTMTGARIFREVGKVFIIGTQEAIENARLEVKSIVSKTRMYNRNWRLKACCFVDDINLPHNCDLRLVSFENKCSTPGYTASYRLRPTEDDESCRGDACSDGEVPRYLEDLKENVFQCLLKIKNQNLQGEGERNDIWCHFGTVLIENVDEGDAGLVWTLDEITDNLAVSPNDAEDNNGKPQWRTKFEGGVDFDEKLHLGKLLHTPVYYTRHDINFMTPSERAVGCKVWVKEKGHEEDEVEIPCNDVMNILEEFGFADKKTNERCKGWLCLSSMKRLKADILFPACDCDCHITIRGNNDFAMERSPADKEEDLILLEYLSHLILKEGEEDELPLTETLPRGFQNVYKRCCRRTSLSIDQDFFIVVSKESSFRSQRQDGNSIERKTDLHLHCNKWRELLRSGQWEPQDIVEKLAEFLKFVNMVQRLIMLDQKGQF